MRNAGLEEAQAGIKVTKRNINNLRYVDDTILTAESKKELKSPWMKSCDQPTQHIKKQRHYFAKKGLSGRGYGFSSSHVWIVRVGL